MVAPSSPPPPVLLVAGWAGVAADWGAVPKMLAARTGRTFFTYDARGVGDSVRIDGENENETFVSSLELMASDAIDVLSACAETTTNAESPVAFGLGGVSMGGVVSQLVAGAVSSSSSSTTDRRLGAFELESLALVGSTPGGSPPKHPFTSPEFFAAFDRWSDDDDDGGGVNEACAEIFFRALRDDHGPGGPRDRSRRRYVEAFVESRRSHRAGVAGVLAQRDALLRGFDTEPALRRLAKDGRRPTTPSLVVHGRRDRIVPWRNALELQRILGPSSCELFVIDESDHLCWITHALDLVSVWADFLNDR